MRLLLCAAAIILATSNSYAFKIEETKSKIYFINGVAVIQMNGLTFTVADIPSEAVQFESSVSNDLYPEIKITLGLPITANEASSVVEQYYKHTAFDFGSIVIRDFRVGGQQYVFWCTNPWLFGCLERQARAGTWVEFDSNGANRNGGMTGFQRKILLIRKVGEESGSITEQPGVSE